MSEILNSTCDICGKKYHTCITCKSVKTFKPWRTITDTIECYKIYMIIHDYTNNAITREKAKEELSACVLPSELQPHIKNVIDEIMNVEKTTVKSKKTEVKEDVSKTTN